MNTVFEATAATGPLRLALPADPAEPGDAVAAALTLAAQEPLVQALEAWLKQPLDLRPLAGGDAALPLHWAQAEGARIGLPWAALLAAGAPAPAAWQWPTLVFDIELAAFDAPPLPAARGSGVLLLPPSFEPPWRVALHAQGEPLAAEADWRGPGSPLALLAPPETSAAPRAAWRVLLAEPLALPLPQWLGWQAAPSLPVGGAGAAARLVGPEGPVAEGRLAPALGGFGLVL